MGTVDPTGYIDRSLNNPSQSRSGLAAAAIQRLNGTPQFAPGDPGVGQLNGTPPQYTPPLTGANYGSNGTDPLQQISQSVFNQNSPADQSLAQQRSPGGALPVPKVAPLNVNSIGQISLPPSQSLPLDADLAAQEAAQTSAANNQLAQFQNQQQALAAQYALSAHNQSEKFPGVLNALLANYGSGRGLGFSSGYGTAYNNDQNAQQQALDQLYSAAQQGLAGVQTNAALVPTTLSNAIQQILATQAARNNTLLNAGGTTGLSGVPALTLNPKAAGVAGGVGGLY
jgi:hypothetical protein